jgi:hypothetical protein
MNDDVVRPDDVLCDGTLARDWEDCAVPGCKNKRCVRLGSIHCYPHSQDPVSDVIKRLETLPAGVTTGAEL